MVFHVWAVMAPTGGLATSLGHHGVLFKPRKQKLCVKTYQRNKKGSQSITKPTEILKEMEKF